MEIWHGWLIAGIVFFCFEVFVSPDFFMASLALGCFAAALTDRLDGGLVAQFFVFSVLTLFSIFAVRPFFKKFIYRFDDPRKIGIDALIGRTARVTEGIDNASHAGRVQIDGESWQARSITDEMIGEKETVRIQRVESSMLFVEKP